MSNRPLVFLLAAVLVLSCAAPSASVETLTWRLETADDLNGGTAEGVSVSGDGTLVLSPAAVERAALPEPMVLALALMQDGTLLAGTGGAGRIYRIPADGEPALFVDDLGLQVAALLPRPGGGAWAAWNPSGALLLVNEEGDTEEILDPEPTYVWDLAVDDEGGLWVATGDPAQVLWLDPSGGEAVTILESPESNLTALLLDGKGNALVGTDGEGLLLRVDPGGVSELLWDSDLRQISALALAPTGDLYAAAVAPHEPETGKTEAKKNDGNNKNQKTGKARSAVVRIGTDGMVETLWEGEDEPVFSLALADLPGRDGPALLAGTGTGGRVYALEGDGRRTLLVDTEQEQIADILPVDGGALLATANLGRVYRLRSERSARGVYTSPVHDAGALSHWGAFRWEGERPGGATLRFETRSGTTVRPDDTWSPWVVVRGDAVRSPAHRRLQWRAEMKASERGAGPEVRAVEVAWMQRNLPPEVEEVEVHGPGLVYDKKLATKSIEEGAPDRFSSTAGPAKSAKAYRLAGWRTVSWKASDPNDDTILHRLDLRREDAGDGWFTLARDLDGTAFAWDARTLADGRYLARVVASDSPSNPPGAVLEGERTARPFLVDNSPPVVAGLRLREEADGVRLTFRATDGADVVAAAAVSVAGGPWKPLLPEDGIPDQAEERFSTLLSGVRKGDLVVVRASDRAGNVHTASVTAR